MYTITRPAAVMTTSILEVQMMGGHISPTGSPTTSIQGISLLQLLIGITIIESSTIVNLMKVLDIIMTIIASPVNHITITPRMLTLTMNWKTITIVTILLRGIQTNIHMVVILVVVILIMMIIGVNRGGLYWLFVLELVLSSQ